MRELPWTPVEPYRLAGAACSGEGAFGFHHKPTNSTLRVVVSSDDGWEHVSVSAKNRPPNWAEMEFVCRLFWREDEAVMQLHPPRRDWINNHPYCLHLWRPVDATIPLPPTYMVGLPEFNGADGTDPEVRRRMNEAWARKVEDVNNGGR